MIGLLITLLLALAACIEYLVLTRPQKVKVVLVERIDNNEKYV